MALQLKNKTKEENTEKDKAKKGGKYRRKRNVFGKSTTRFGLIGVIAFLAIAFVSLKVIATLKQNKDQKRIDDKLAEVEKKIKKDQAELNKKIATYENVGKLIATLPASFDQQATSIDLDRIITLSGLTESGISTRKISEISTMPISCSVSTVKAVQIQLTLYGENDDIDSTLKFVNYLSDYSHENFYYIEKLSYAEDRLVNKRSTTTVTMYTFYNDTDLTKTK
ncbi:MAG: hypothetical protein J6Y28_09070 [Acholeplasmatales bacterium]|nr:hypothetical protein [Acholeplasmatales bacterium]